MLCVTDWQARPVQDSWGRFAALRELCSEAGDKVSLAIGMTGLASELLYTGRPGEGSRLASEQMELLESVGDPALTVGLSFTAFANWFNSGHFTEILRWSQTVIDLAAGHPDLGGDFGVGSPLALSLAFRGIARFWLGRDGWRVDLPGSALRRGPAERRVDAVVRGHDGAGRNIQQRFRADGGGLHAGRALRCCSGKEQKTAGVD